MRSPCLSQPALCVSPFPVSLCASFLLAALVEAVLEAVLVDVGQSNSFVLQ